MKSRESGWMKLSKEEVAKYKKHGLEVTHKRRVTDIGLLGFATQHWEIKNLGKA